MSAKRLRAFALARAVKVLGGVTEVARRLRISQTRLNLYLEDLEPIPETVFLALVDVLVDDEVARIAKEREARRANSREAITKKNANGSGKGRNA